MDCTRQTILLVEDEPVARAFLADNLTADGYEILEAGTLAAARRLIGTRFLDLAIVDLGLPDGDGLELLRMVRESDRRLARVDPQLPLLVLSGRATEVDRLRGFDRGCDDYVVRPFNYGELRARIRALLRRGVRGPAATRVRIGPLEVDALARQVWLDGETVNLSSKEFSLLRALAAEPARVFTREELLQIVWGWTDAGRTRTLDSHASRLRRKLSVGGARFVINVWGLGYRLVDGTSE